MSARSGRSAVFGLAGAALFATLCSPHTPAHAQAGVQSLLHAQYQQIIFIDSDYNLACTGCRYEGPPGKRKDVGKVVISDKIGAGVSPRASVGTFLILWEDQGTSCPAGGWYALHLNTLALTEIKTQGCVEVSKADYLVNEDNSVIVTLTHYDKKKAVSNLK